MLVFKLKKIMDERKITISDLSNRTGISRPSISAMYNNQSKSVNIEILSKLADELRVDYTDIFVNEKDYFVVNFVSVFENSNEELFVELLFKNSEKEINTIFQLTSNFYTNNLGEIFIRYIYFDIDKTSYDDVIYILSKCTNKNISDLYIYILENVFFEYPFEGSAVFENMKEIMDNFSKMSSFALFEVGLLSDIPKNNFVFKIRRTKRKSFLSYPEKETRNVSIDLVFE